MKRVFSIVIILLFILPAFVIFAPENKEDPALKARISDFFDTGTVRNEPHTRSDGKPFHICYVDIDPYPASGEMLYYLLEELNDLGWMNIPSFAELPFDPQDTDAGRLIDYLAERGTGEYISFSKDQNYYIALDDREDVKAGITDGIAAGEVDLILCLGTSPGELVINEMGIKDVPVVVYFSVDPVGAGLSETQEYSGKDNVWCHTSSDVYINQLRFYFDTMPFSCLGMAYYSESVAAAEIYRNAASSLGASVVEEKIETIRPGETKEEYYSRLKAVYEKLVNEDGIDAFLLNTDMIKDSYAVEPLLSVFYDSQIPVFVQNGQFFVAEGAFMLMSASDAKAQAPFAVNAVTSILSGKKPGEIYQKYIPSPYVSVNLDAAAKIGYDIPEDILRSAERIYGGGMK
ncbi:MAG: hypothetical protein IK071_09430 [Lachnospiraceae bacterium]|nr:hypothetical protein [Lachnospiraceae bacterium]